jgi:hypothetical protein
MTANPAALHESVAIIRRMTARVRFLAFLAASVCCAVALAQPVQPRPAAPQTAQPQGPQPQTNLLAEAARELGVKQCLPAVDRLSALAVAGSRTHDVLVDWDRSGPDAGPFFSLMGISYGPQSVAATITAIPQGNGGCTISAERISVAPYTCKSIAEVELKGYAATALLPTFTVYTQKADPGASVSLIDSPPGCLVIRRHVQYRWVDPAATPAAAPLPNGPRR